MTFANDIKDLIGNTPLIKLNKISNATGNTVLGKCEFLNPTSSIKDRLALGILQDAFDKGKITKKTTIIEATSGNTGVALAAICATYGISLILTMPSSMSVERAKLMEFLGAKIEKTEPRYGMQGAIDKAHQLLDSIKDSFMLKQFDNNINVDTHKNTTAMEILKDTNNKVDIFISGSGTSGTITGVSQVLKEKNLDTKIILVEPEESMIIYGKESGAHKIQGIGPNFIPSIFDKNFIDEIIGIKYEDALLASQKIARQEGILVGISSGANLHIAKQVSKQYENQNKTIITMLCDTAERYISTPLFAEPK